MQTQCTFEILKRGVAKLVEECETARLIQYDNISTHYFKFTFEPDRNLQAVEI